YAGGHLTISSRIEIFSFLRQKNISDIFQSFHVIQLVDLNKNKDFYETLEMQKNTSQSGIKKAYYA
ncbi:3131_t:CDS:2, partial [Entrophospora sp. SA101]